MDLKNGVLDRIFMITERVIVFDGLDDVFEHIVKTAVQLTNAEAATIRVFDIETGLLEIVKGYGVTDGFLSQPSIRVGEGLIGIAVQTGKSFSTTDVKSESDCKNAELAQIEKIKSLMCVPMKTKESTIGCITVYRKDNTAFEDHDLMLLSIFASEAVEAVEKARLMDELKKQATFDSLTGIYNKQAIIEKLKVELDRSKRHNYSLALLFIDLDGFKEFNDDHGHLMGDKLIHDFTTVLRNHSRKIDILGRFGGDEFIIIAPQSDIAGATVLAEKLRQAVEDQGFLSSKVDQVHHTSCSIGIAMFPSHSDNLEGLLEKSDKALYESKRKGRNCVSLWNEIDQVL